MKIVNRTHWRTDHLRAIVARVAADELDAAKRRRMTVYIVYSRRHTSGCAHVGGDYIRVRVQKTPKPGESIDKIGFAYVVAHEFAHARGLRHRDPAMFNCANYHRIGDVTARIYAWVLDMPIERAEKPAKPAPASVAAKKYAHVVTMVDTWTRRARLAKTKLQVWTRKRKYYEKRMAAMAAPREGATQ